MPERNFGSESLFCLRRNISSLYWPRRYDINRNPKPAQFHGSGTAERLQRGFAGSIGYFAWEACCSISAHIDDTAPVCAAFDVASSVFRHHQRDCAAVDRKMPVMILCCDRLNVVARRSIVIRP